MTNELKEMLKNAGIDIDSVIARFGGREELAVKFYGKFPEDPNFSELKKNLEAGDVKASFIASHSLKGVAGNLGMVELFDKNNVVVEALRAGNLEPAKEGFPDVETAYNKVIEVIKKF